MCLLDTLNEIRKERLIDFNIYVAHINHMIREEAIDDEKYVEDYCNRNNIKYYIKRIDVVKIANDKKIGTEEAGRNARYVFFEEILKETNSNKIAIAHNKNDKIETIIMHLLRGSGLSGLKGIEPIRNNKYIRPLIECERSEIEKYCKPTRLNIAKIEYFKLWVELFLKYPLDYLEAYVNMNKYYFYPNKYIENIYYTSIYPNEYGIKYIDNNETLINKIETSYSNQKKIPLVSSLFSPGTVVFILLIGLYYCLLKKNKTTFVSMFHLLVNFLILMAFVPLNDEFRYIYPVVACLPLIITQTISNNEYKEGNAKWRL